MDTVIDIYDYEDDYENQEEIKIKPSYKTNKKEIKDFGFLIFIVIIIFIIECFLTPDINTLNTNNRDYIMIYN